LARVKIRAFFVFLAARNVNKFGFQYKIVSMLQVFLSKCVVNLNQKIKNGLFFGNVSRKMTNSRKYAAKLGISRTILPFDASFHAKKSVLY